MRTLANIFYDRDLTAESAAPLLDAFEISLDELKADFNNCKAMGLKATILVGSNSEPADILGVNHILAMQNRFSLKAIYDQFKDIQEEEP